MPSMTDYFGFTLAAMNEKGSVFANPKKGDKIPSTIMYRPFNSWTNNSEVNRIFSWIVYCFCLGLFECHFADLDVWSSFLVESAR